MPGACATRRSPSSPSGDALLAYHVGTSANPTSICGGGVAIVRRSAGGGFLAAGRRRSGPVGRARGRARTRRHGDRRLDSRPRRVRRLGRSRRSPRQGQADRLARLGHLARRGRRPGRSGDGGVDRPPRGRQRTHRAQPPRRPGPSAAGRAATSRRFAASPQRPTTCGHFRIAADDGDQVTLAVEPGALRRGSCDRHQRHHERRARHHGVRRRALAGAPDGRLGRGSLPGDAGPDGRARAGGNVVGLPGRTQRLRRAGRRGPSRCARPRRRPSPRIVRHAVLRRPAAQRGHAGSHRGRDRRLRRERVERGASDAGRRGCMASEGA